ncbi:pirin family protein [Bacterioplanoides sp.]|uniref:pirin family protein n=1 Tax=Bacterioplanoides sp. TaxID=2066072 RepID=UPI003B5BCB56
MTTSYSDGSRQLQHIVNGMAASDGDGVRLTRIIGSPQLNMFDPFLLLDTFESDNPDDYIGGFPTHPHRGFETVTYLLNGRMRHKDSAGHEGVIEPGGVQWMTAGKGILHSEMPEQENGLLKGFQLWVNLPASAKMTEPKYQEFPPRSTPLEQREDGSLVRVISGTTALGTSGPVSNDYTLPLYLDVQLAAGAEFHQPVDTDHNAFIYVIEGQVAIGEHSLAEKQLGVLTAGESVQLLASDQPARFLLVAGKPLNEPVARGGPFVMNTKAEVMQAFEDFNNGNF